MKKIDIYIPTKCDKCGVVMGMHISEEGEGNIEDLCMTCYFKWVWEMNVSPGQYEVYEGEDDDNDD